MGQVQLALVGVDLGQVAAPQHIRRDCGELALHQVRRRGPLALLGQVLRAPAGRAAGQPELGISLATVFSLTCQPAAHRSSVMRGEP